MMSSAVQSQKLIFAAGAACVLAIAVVYALRVQTGTKAKKQNKQQRQQQQQQQQQPQQQQQIECKENNTSQLECAPESVGSDSGEQRENDRMQISAIAAPETGDDLRLDSGIGSPKGTPSLENRSNSEQMVEQASDFIEESFSAVYSQTNGIETSSLFVETSNISIAESEPKPQETLESESVSELTAAKIKEVVEGILESTASKMTENTVDNAVASENTATAEVTAEAPSVTQNEQASKSLEFSPEPSPAREIKKSSAKKDSSPAKEKVSRRKAAARSKEQLESAPIQSKAKNNDDRNNNTRRQSTGSDVVTDSKSEGSADSSKAGSDSCPATVSSVLYHFKHEFELPTELCGRLIGRHGSNVKDIRERTGAIVTVRPHPVEYNLKQVYVVGKQEESVNLAMAEIRKKFPLKLYPQLTLCTVDRQGLSGLGGTLPPNYLALPEDQDTVVTLTAMDGVNRLYLQSPNNQTYGLFLHQEMKMMSVHGSAGTEPPLLPANLIRPNAICVVHVASSGACWYRVAIDSVISADEVRVKFVDYGGHETLHPNRLRQIRSDFIYIPFQAIEVLLADIEPVSPDGTWTQESIEAVQAYAGGANTDLLVRVVGYSGAIPCVQLTCIVRDSGNQISLSHQLVSEGHAKWATDSNRSSPAAQGSETSSGPTFSPADFPQLGATQKTC